jgi:amino acid transporter
MICDMHMGQFKESAGVASVIFCVHMITMVTLVIASAIYVITNGTSMFVENSNSPLQPSIGKAIFYGFSAASLGISGFESSANFIEEQEPGTHYYISYIIYFP